MRTSSPALLRQRFVPEPESVGLARDFVTGALAAWGMEECTEDVRLCASELASNALLHGHGPERMFLVGLERADDLLRLEVHDSCPQQHPALRLPATTDTNGRGLLIVEALADDWGIEEVHPEGKVVWTHFKIPALCRSRKQTSSSSTPGNAAAEAPAVVLEQLTAEQRTGKACCWCRAWPDRTRPVSMMLYGTGVRLRACLLCADLYEVPAVEAGL